MKTQLVGCLLLLSLFSYSQEKPSYISTEAGLEMSKTFTTDLSLRVGAGVEFARHLYAGGNGGVTLFFNKKKVSTPIAFTLRYMGNANESGITPFFSLEPGYHFYNDVSLSELKQVQTKGGFCLYGGGGIIYHSVSISVGYSQFGWNVDGRSITEHRITGRIGGVF